MQLRLTIVVAAAVLLSACGPRGSETPGAPAKAAENKPARPLLLAPEDLRTVASGQQSSGPVITGAVQPERRADLRSEVAAVLLQVVKENGDSVRAGDLIARLDDTSIRDSLTSAEASERAAAQALDQAERTVQRLKTLQAQGMTSQQALDDAEVRRNAAQSELVAARARAVGARQQLRRTEVRAPFAGVVSERKVSAGDTVQVGKEIAKVIDPRSMRFEGLVSADRVSELKLGQRVTFRVNGYPGEAFAGTVQRIDAAANAVTRQVQVMVAFEDTARAPKVAGLFAEGRIETGATTVLMLPEGSVVKSGDNAHVWKLNGNTLAKVAVKLGERDERSGSYPVLQGLAAGDRVLRNPGSNLSDGQKVEIAAPKAAAEPASAVTASK
jgi:membrane fusion protein, multidrug efflux system